MGKVVRSDPQSLIKLPKPGPFHSQSLIIGSWELRNKMTRGVSLFPAAKLLTLIHTGGLREDSGRGRAGKANLSVQVNPAGPACCYPAAACMCEQTCNSTDVCKHALTILCRRAQPFREESSFTKH